MLARYLDDLDVDTLNTFNGAYASDMVRHHVHRPCPQCRHRCLNQEAGKLLCPVMVANRINDPSMAENIIRMGKADFVDMGQSSICDPHLPNKTKAGKFDQIHDCIGCLQGCAQIFDNGSTGICTCLVNPRVGWEFVNNLSPVETAEEVMVIGVGSARLIAAKTAAKRGHKATVFEKDSHEGGLSHG